MTIQRMKRRTSGRAKTRQRRRFTLEPLEPRVVLDAMPIISEVMAINDSVLTDDFDEAVDWIELFNSGDATVNLDGWFLTDNEADLDRWRLPAVDLPAGGYLLVYASGRDLADAANPLHTNFKLSGGGEYLALVEPDGVTVAYEFAPEFPPQIADISYGALATDILTPLLSQGDTAQFLIPTDNSLGLSWTEQAFDASAWTAGPTGIGYDLGGEDSADIATDVTAEMSGTASSVLIRTPFNVDDPADIDSLNLRIKYDDGFVAYLNGEQIAARNAPAGGESPASGLVAYYPFDDVLSDDASDFPSNSGTTENDLTGVGGTTRFVSGMVGDAIALGDVAADQDRLTANLDSDLDLGGVFTIEGWIYPTQLSGWSRLVMEWDGAGKNTLFFALRNGTALSLFQVDGSGVQKNVDSPIGTVGLGNDVGWQHIAVVGDGSDLRLYYNGTEVSAGSNGVSPVPTPTPYSGTSSTLSANLGIGDSAGSPSASNSFRGYLDEFAMWNVALTPEQIASHFQAAEAGYGLDSVGGSDALAFDATALSERPEDEETTDFEDIDLSEYLGLLTAGENVLAIQGLNASASSDDFLILPELIAANRVLDVNTQGYLAEPTPGEPNADSFFALVADVSFSAERGYYDAPFALTIATDTPEVTIRYTLDGSVPTESTGLVYSGPINVSSTSTVRAAAFTPGFQSSQIVTHTYLFVADILLQTNEAPPGAIWDTGLDPEVVNNTDQTYSVAEALVAIPTVSIVMDNADLFGSGGIYPNAQNRGAAWERAGSIEYFYPDEYEGYRSGDGFAVTAGIRMTGGASRADHNPKKSFRFSFKDQFGPSKLNFPLFENSPVERFDTLMLRTGHNQGWFTGNASSQYLREPYAFDIQRDLGQPASNASFAHLYLNGTYWGLYLLNERPDESYASERYGGEKEDYDVLKGQVPTNATQAKLIGGNRDAWSAMFAVAERDLSDPANYQEIQKYLDVDNLIDYIISTNVTGEQDAPT